MALTTDILFNWKGDASGLKKSADQASGAVDSTSAKLSAVGGTMVGVGKKMSLAALPIVATFKVGFDSLNENEALLAQTEAVIESMGGAANVTAEDVFDLANELSGMSGMAHESLVEGQNLLLTFGNIRNEAGAGNDVFNQTTRILADMSTALGMDAKQGALQLGKALNDPVKGVTALTRVGVSFTDQQIEQIKAMTESGDVMGAQKMILGELEKQFGGSAAAAGQTMAGQINIAKNSFEEMSRTLTSVLMPVFNQLVGWMQKVFNWFNSLSPAQQAFITKLAAVAVAAGPVLIVGGKLIGAFQKVGAAFKGLSALMAANPWVLIIAATVALVTLIVANWDKIKAFLSATWEAIKSALGAAWEWIKSAVQTAIDFIVNLFMNWTAPGLIIQHWDTIKEAFSSALEFVKNLVMTVWNAIATTIRTILTGIASFLSATWNAIQAAATAVWNAIKTFFENVWKGIKLVFTTALSVLRSALDAYRGFVRTVWNALWNGVKTFFENVWKGIKLVLKTAFSVMRAAFNGFRSFFVNAWNNVWKTVKTAFQRAWDAIKQLAGRFIDIGKSIVDGIVKGLGGLFKAIYNKLKSAITGAINAVKDFLGIGSPSKVFAIEVGAPLMEGIAEGVAAEREKTQRAIQRAVTGLSRGLTIGSPAFGGIPSSPGSFGAQGSQTVIHVYVAGSVVTEQDLANTILDRIQIIQRHRP